MTNSTELNWTSVVSWRPLVALISPTRPPTNPPTHLCTILRHSIWTSDIIHHITLDLVDNFKGDTRCGRAQPQLVILFFNKSWLHIEYRTNWVNWQIYWDRIRRFWVRLFDVNYVIFSYHGILPDLHCCDLIWKMEDTWTVDIFNLAS